MGLSCFIPDKAGRLALVPARWRFGALFEMMILFLLNFLQEALSKLRYSL